VYVSGYTRSSDFPTTPGSYDPTYNPYDYIYISKFDSTLSTLLASTFLGYGEHSALAIDSLNNVFVAGLAFSIPTTPEAYDPISNGNRDGFISKFDSNLSDLLSSTYLGSNGIDYINDIAIDSSENIFVTGQTTADFPTTTGAYETEERNIFVSKLDNNLYNLLASTFLGDGNVRTLAIDSSDNVFVAGFTDSSYFPTTQGAFDEIHNGNEDGFVSKFDNNLSTCPNLPARISGTPFEYSSVQDAYDASAGGQIIQSQDLVFTEDVYLDIDQSVIIRGGYNCDYSLHTRKTIINGNMTISDGITTIEDLELQ
jgi:hypothetical protein